MTDISNDEMVEEVLEEFEPNGPSNLFELLSMVETEGYQKQKMWAQFNKITGAPVSLISYVPLENLNQEMFDYVECEGCPFSDVIEGTIDDFRIVPMEEQKQVVTETMLNETAVDRVTKKYKVIDQINNIRKLVMKMCEVVGNEEIMSSEEYLEALEMDEYIEEVLRVNKLTKEYYENAEGFEYVSTEQMEREFDAAIEGGIRDSIGPRQVGSGSRIF